MKSRKWIKWIIIYNYKEYKYSVWRRENKDWERVRRFFCAWIWMDEYFLEEDIDWLIEDLPNIFDKLSKEVFITDNRKRAFWFIEKAFNANRDAHMARDRAILEASVNFVTSKNYAKKHKIEKDKLYKDKLHFIRKAISLIEEAKIDIEYGQRDWIMFFKYKDIMVTFHIFWANEIKQTNLIWDWKRHKTFPFKI